MFESIEDDFSAETNVEIKEKSSQEACFFDLSYSTAKALSKASVAPWKIPEHDK